MDQLKSYADERLRQSCVFCGGVPDTRDHVPSRVLLDCPYPENLPIIGACRSCNNGFSQDEEYLACLVDCVLAGAVDPAQVGREKIARILRERPALTALLEAARTESETGTMFSIDDTRVRNVLRKLAIGHAAYELDERLMDTSNAGLRVSYVPLTLLDDTQTAAFETPPSSELWPEVGCRWMQRYSVVSVRLASTSNPADVREVQLLVPPGWVEVQPGRYRYLAGHDDAGNVVVRMVLSEYLACEVAWSAPHQA